MTRHEFTKDTRYLYEALSAGLYDCPECFRAAQPLMESLCLGDMFGIRQGFRDGMIGMMAPDLMAGLDELPKDDEVEIRITHNGKTIGIVIDSEITW